MQEYHKIRNQINKNCECGRTVKLRYYLKYARAKIHAELNKTN